MESAEREKEKWQTTINRWENVAASHTWVKGLIIHSRPEITKTTRDLGLQNLQKGRFLSLTGCPDRAMTLNIANNFGPPLLNW